MVVDTCDDDAAAAAARPSSIVGGRGDEVGMDRTDRQPPFLSFTGR